MDNRSPPDIQGTKEPHTRMNPDTNPWTGTHNMKHSVVVSSQLNFAADTAVCRQLISQSVIIAVMSLETVYSEPSKSLSRLISKLQQENTFVAWKIAEIDLLGGWPTSETKA